MSLNDDIVIDDFFFKVLIKLEDYGVFKRYITKNIYFHILFYEIQVCFLF